MVYYTLIPESSKIRIKQLLQNHSKAFSCLLGLHFNKKSTKKGFPSDRKKSENGLDLWPKIKEISSFILFIL